ncbi:allophanate hydrolase [Stutzerimonas stutzeri]|uniref:Allophanate hydrolase n=1 Tax=Stutzerimonas stutzeri TaxID=316 RepID=W8R0F2_STUST|nr:5-oxoprolinase subunit PxpB [Stutzerimonas stutzeri]AHL76370.1 allophanate hydrolase [Stutzerimonas stutzeri]MCQ4329602.1 5-oxoprolinase subunit PxpB [Stutzerimonas stutzeri]
MKPRIEVVGIDSLMLRLFDEIDEAHMPWLLAAATRLREAFGGALIDLVPSYTTLLVHYDLTQLDDHQARQCIADALYELKPDAGSQARELNIPVWYDPSVGPELEALGQRSGLGVSGVIEHHSSRTYQVFALGFAPGFAFMGLVDEILASPRLQTPRKQVPAGSLGIADRQTAIYPLISPGGWNLIGRSPTRLFDRDMDGYSIWQPGDHVRFQPIEHAEFIRLGGDDSPFEVTP